MISMDKLAATGIPGLDRLLGGGLPRGKVYLVQGLPGAGKTTLGLQFLLEGIRTGERVMMISLIETRTELAEVAESHGWSLDGIHLLEPSQQVKASTVEVQTVFPPGEVEFGELSNAIIEGVEQYKPVRLLLDSVSQLSMLTDSWQQMRSTILKLRDLVQTLGCTLLLTSGNVEKQALRLGADLQGSFEMDTIVHGSFSLEVNVPAYGQISRSLIIKKMRGYRYVTGFHNFRIRTGGIEVFTWPEVRRDPMRSEWQVLSSGIRGLDDLLGGGLEEGTACLVTGSSGAGKSTLSSLYVQAAAKRGQGSIIFCFDERKDTFMRRSAALKMEMPAYIQQGLVDLRQLSAGDLSPGEFAHIVREAVEQKNAKVVFIDSLTGYLNAMPEEKLLLTQLHELLNYLGGIGVLTIMAEAKFGVSGNVETAIEASYLADTVILLRHFEALGNIRRCIVVIKKRHGRHEHTIREFKIEASGCQVGPPLIEFNGLLTGNPTFVGNPADLLDYRRKR